MAHKNPWPDEGNTGHIWDEDLRELDNPPPLWWMLAFYAGFVMIIFYSIYYPTIPLPNGYTKGVAGWTQVGELHQSQKELNDWRKARFAEQEEKLAALPLAEIIKDPKLKEYAVATSKMLFGDNCAACHGIGGQGNPDFPVLADDDWIWGGKPSQIDATITNGRLGNMPAKGMMGNLTTQDIDHVADYVIALSKGEGAKPAYAAGQAVFKKGMCFACHGPSGKPLTDLAGAANLTDGIWRFSGSKAEVVKTITYGVNVKKWGKKSRLAQMPSFKDRLSKVNIKRLAVYVHELGGGQ